MDCSSSSAGGGGGGGGGAGGGDALAGGGGRLRAALARFAPHELGHCTYTVQTNTAHEGEGGWLSRHQLDAVSLAVTGARLPRTLRDGLAAAVAPGAAPGADAWRLLELTLRRAAAAAAAADPEAHPRAVFSALGGGEHGVLSRQDFAAAARQAAPALPPLAVGEAFDALSGGGGAGLGCRAFLAAAAAAAPQRRQV